MKQIPNLFTLLNLVFGCFAIVFIMQNGIVLQYSNDGSQVVSMPEKIVWGSLFIGLAAIVDFLDGFVARLFKATSEMGKQLDSLADVVSFGVAPSMILYQLLRLGYASDENGLNVSMIGLCPAFIIAACAAYRLAKFNIDESQSTVFKGIPTPAAGLFIASLPLIYWYSDNPFVFELLLNKWLLYALVVFVSMMMISNIPMMSLKFKSKQLKDHFPQLILFVIALVTSLLLHWLSVPFIFLSYILLSLIYKKRFS